MIIGYNQTNNISGRLKAIMFKKLFSKLNKKDNFEDTRNAPIVKEPTPKIVPPLLDVYTFNVAGVTAKNEEKQDIQKLLKQKGKLYLKENGIESFGGFKNKEIIEDYLEVSEFEDILLTKQDISFVPEPTNKYDSNAIKLYIKFDEVPMHIGYVPKEDNIEVKSILENEDIRRIEVRFVGGKIKSVEYDDEKDKDVVVTVELTLGIEVKIHFLKKDMTVSSS